MKKILTLIVITLLIIACTKNDEIIDDPVDDKQDEVVVKEKIRTSFLAVGDNLIHSAIYDDPNFYHNNVYDYRSIYSEIKPDILKADISYINQETILGGREIGLSHYPAFNSPHEIGDAIIDAGFDWVNHATNHTLDRGEVAIINTLEYWDKHPEIYVSGIARNQEEANKQLIMEKNGIKFGLLAYTYGTNGIPIPQNKDYLVNLIDYGKIEKDVLAIRDNVDILLVSLHWGVEYTFLQNQQQEDLANFLADLKVDVIIGTHPHVIQPIEIIKTSDEHETLVMYSLGNFLSAQDVNYRMLGGLVEWDIVFDPNDNSKSFENIVFKPTINYYDINFRNYKIYYLKDYNNIIANTHGLSTSYNMSVEYFKDLVDEVIGDKVKIDYWFLRLKISFLILFLSIVLKTILKIKNRKLKTIKISKPNEI